jgi:hypothetical protein
VAKKDGSKLSEKGRLEWLGEEISKHLSCGTVGNCEILLTGMVGDEKIRDINVAGALPAGRFAVAFHLDGTFVILVENGLGNGVALCLHKHFHIECVWEVIAGTDELGFCRAFCINLLASRLADDAAAAERDDAAVWLRMSEWTAKDASTQEKNEVRESAPSIRAMSLVARRCCRRRHNFCSSCSVG